MTDRATDVGSGHATLILARHGQSALDAEDRFSGTHDPGLTDRGVREANALAYTLRLAAIGALDHVVTARLEAARRTGEIVMRAMGYHHAPETLAALDERDFGELTGLTRDEAVTRFGAEETARRAHGALGRLGKGGDDPVAAGIIRAYEESLAPRLRRPCTMLVVSYDNNVRALAAHLDRKPPSSDTWRTGMALIYRLDADLAVVARDAVQSKAWPE